jgi:hypothetical protein
MLDFSWQSAFLSDCISKAALFPWKPSGFDNVAGVMQLCHLVRSHPFPPALELNEPVSDVVEYSNYPRIVLQRFTANLFKHRSRRFALLSLCLLTDNKTVLFALQYAYCNHAIRDPSQSPLSGPVRDIVLAEYAWYASLHFLREFCLSVRSAVEGISLLHRWYTISPSSIVNHWFAWRGILGAAVRRLFYVSMFKG